MTCLPVRPDVKRISNTAIRRALEAWAERSAEYADGRGKSAKGQDLAAGRIHDEWWCDCVVSTLGLYCCCPFGAVVRHFVASVVQLKACFQIR